MTEEELAQSISEAAAKSFSEAQNAIGREQIIGYAVMSHDTADSCGPIAATIKGSEAFSYGSREDFLYSPEEWDYSASDVPFEAVNEAIGKLYDAGDYEKDPDWHNRFRQLVFNANVRALEILIEKGFFGSAEERDGLFIVLCISDSEESVKSAPGWAERLNTPKVFQSFMTWHYATFSGA